MHVSNININVIIFQITYTDHRVMLYFMDRGALNFMFIRWKFRQHIGLILHQQVLQRAWQGVVFLPGRDHMSVKDPSSWFASSKKDGAATGKLCGAVITDPVYFNTRLTDVRAVSSFNTDIIQINNSNVV